MYVHMYFTPQVYKPAVELHGGLGSNLLPVTRSACLIVFFSVYKCKMIFVSYEASLLLKCDEYIDT